jgi:Peptidase family S41
VLLFAASLLNTVQELPYNSALKFTVAKYYTPSGRCIQSVDYSSGGVATAVSTVGDAPTTIVPSEQVTCLPFGYYFTYTYAVLHAVRVD